MENEKRKEDEAAKALKAAKAAKAAGPKTPKDPDASAAEGSVFDQFAKARSGDAEEIVANINAGRKGMRRKKR